jgi:hypothetical protein
MPVMSSAERFKLMISKAGDNITAPTASESIRRNKRVQDKQ